MVNIASSLGVSLVLLATIAVVAVPVDRVLRPRAEPNLKWGKDGHMITAIIAQQLITPDIQTKINEIIPEVQGNLADIASWADEVKQQSAYFWSAPLHYINTPDWECGFNHVRDCGDNVCVSGAVSNYTQRLITQSGDQQAEALKFLVHFCGDIHQPLHVGFTSDEGGNTIQITYNSKHMNLHELWDSDLIYTLIDTDYQKSYENLANALVAKINTTWAAQAANWTTCTSSFPCPDEWAQETADAACTNAYVNADGVTHIKTGDALGKDYYAYNKDVLELFLAKSGVRMAAALTYGLSTASSKL
eukprot:c25889_g1_i1.p1 GENE.c25889_g1_i1~~c25889_g1_i1.p1  ORF type:complete len:329 (-),score=77.09 c25889_g1_i1:207-1118(-)